MDRSLNALNLTMLRHIMPLRAEAKRVPREITLGATMDPDTKKMALRMIPYGIYVLTAKGSDGSIAAAIVNWVTQTSFDPPLVAIGG